MIPTRFISTCYFCKRELDTREPGVHQYTKGWVKNRTGGGGHGISLAERENRWAHGYCIDRQSSGSFGQAALFERPIAPISPEQPKPTNAAYNERGMLTHICNVCGSQNAPYGYGVALRKGDLGLWYCRDHKPD